MNDLPYSSRITHDPAVMGGRACIRGMRVTAGMIIGRLASGDTPQDILDAFPYLEADDIPAALDFAAWRLQESELLIPEWSSPSV